MITKVFDYIKRNKKNSISASVIILLLILICSVIITNNLKVSDSFYSSEKNESIVGGIFDGVEIAQTFAPKKNHFNAFSLRFATYARECLGDITVSLFKGDELIYAETFPASSLADTAFKKFSFDSVSDSKGELFKIVVTATDTGDLPATLWRTEASTVNKGSMTINGVQTLSELNLILYSSHNFAFIDVVTILFFAALIFAVIIMLRNKMFIFTDSINLKYIRIMCAGILIFTAISSVKVSVTDGETISRALNILPLILLTLMFLLLAALEVKLKFYSSIFNYIKTEVLEFGNGISEKKLLYVVIKGARLISTAAFAVIAAIFIAGAYVSGTAFKLMLILSIAVIATHILYSATVQKNRHPAMLFLTVAIVLGILLAYTLPATTSNSWDEHIHYGNALTLKQHFLPGQSHADYLSSTSPNHYRYYNLTDIEKNIIPILTDSETASTANLQKLNFYSSVSYLPYALVMIFSELLSVNHFTELVLAKSALVFLYALVIFFGIRKLKSGAYLFSAIALMPTCIFLAASFSYDAWTFAFIAYAFAYFFSELQSPEKNINEKDMLLMLGTMLLGCASKPVYFILILPLLLFKKEKFGTRGDKLKHRIACAASMLLIFASFALPFIISPASQTDIRGGYDVNSAAQLDFILSSPFKYAGIFLNFLGNYANLYSMNKGITFLAYIGSAPNVYGTLAILLIAFCVFADKGDIDYKKAVLPRTATYAAIFLSVLLICTALYISFTPVMDTTIRGCQFRYLFPLFPAVFYCIGGNVKSRIKSSVMKFSVFGIITLNLLLTYFEIYLKMFL